MNDKFTIRIDRADRDEFTIYPWGEIRNGEVVKTFEEGKEHFGLLEEQIERVQPKVEGTALTEQWLEEHRSVGTMAQRPRALAGHPLIDRHLGYEAYQCIAILRGFDNESSTVESVTQLQATADGVLRVRFSLPTGMPNPEQATRQTMHNIVSALNDQPSPRYDRQLCEQLVLRAYRYQREIWRVDVDCDKLSDPDFEFDTKDLEAVARTYHIDGPAV